MANLLPTIYWSILSGVLLTFGDISMRFFIDKYEKYDLFLVTVFLYTFGVFCMMMSFFGKDIAVATVMAIIFNAVFLLLINNFYFNEPLSLMGYLGILVAFIAVIILEVYV